MASLLRILTNGQAGLNHDRVCLVHLKSGSGCEDTLQTPLRYLMQCMVYFLPVMLLSATCRSCVPGEVPQKPAISALPRFLHTSSLLTSSL